MKPIRDGQRPARKLTIPTFDGDHPRDERRGGLQGARILFPGQGLDELNREPRARGRGQGVIVPVRRRLNFPIGISIGTRER